MSDRSEAFLNFDRKGEYSYDLQQIIEKSQQMVSGLHPVVLRPKTTPSLHVGLEPVIALSTPSIDNSTIENFTDAQSYFEVVCECTIDTAYPTYRPHAVMSNVGPADVVWDYDDHGTPLIQFSMFNGVYQTTKPA